jgi:anti-sigma regulatory factor (Ser/Thr protein kinase)
MCHKATRGLACDVSAARAGRQFITERFSEWGVGPAEGVEIGLDDVLLAATELIANAVRYCEGEIGLALETHHDAIALGVTDGHAAPAVVHRADPHDESGRGLALVEAVTTRWGQERHGATKTVWCEFPLPAGSVLAVGCSRAGASGS